MNFPNDADGDVFRRLEENGFNFTFSADVDFNVDFNIWPPPKEAIDILNAEYKSVEIYEPEDGYQGYILITIKSLISYGFVIDTQQKITSLVTKFGGVCESWGILQ